MNTLRKRILILYHTDEFKDALKELFSANIILDEKEKCNILTSKYYICILKITPYHLKMDLHGKRYHIIYIEDKIKEEYLDEIKNTTFYNSEPLIFTIRNGLRPVACARIDKSK